MEAASASEPIEQTKKKVVKPLSKAKLQKHLAAAENTGVVYLSHIPPFLKPNKLRDLLSGMGTEVLRVYLAPEDTKARAGRLRAGGNKKKKFTEGWVEFDDKRRAKRIASTLNNTPIGGLNRGFYTHDLWNVKYLHKFKWSHLTEKIAYESRVRRDKMQAELSHAKKESSFYLQKVEQAKAIDAMEERKRTRQTAQGGSTTESREAAAAEKTGPQAGSAVSRKRARSEAPESVANNEATPLDAVRRKFRQRRVVGRDAAAELGAADDRILGSLLSARA